MSSDLLDMIGRYQFTASQKKTLLSRIREEAVKATQPEAIAAIDMALSYVARALSVEHDWRRAHAPKADPGAAKDQDHEIDVLISAIGRALLSEVDLGGDDGDTAFTILQDALPGGTAAHIHADFDTQLVLNDDLVSTLLKPEYADFLGRRRLLAKADELALMNASFRDLLTPVAAMAFSEVRAARANAELATTWAVMRIASHYFPFDAAQVALRDQLLLPLVEMTEKVGQANRADQRSKAKPAPVPVDPPAVDATPPVAVADAAPPAATPPTT